MTRQNVYGVLLGMAFFLSALTVATIALPNDLDVVSAQPEPATENASVDADDPNAPPTTSDTVEEILELFDPEALDTPDERVVDGAEGPQVVVESSPDSFTGATVAPALDDLTSVTVDELVVYAENVTVIESGTGQNSPPSTAVPVAPSTTLTTSTTVTTTTTPEELEESTTTTTTTTTEAVAERQALDPLSLGLVNSGVTVAEADPRLRSENANADPGAFRFFCTVATDENGDPIINGDDAIVLPGQDNATHSHVFFGNTGIDENSTADSLLNTGESTCDGGDLIKGAYWAPALTDGANIFVPQTLHNYYKRRDFVANETIVPPPAGFRDVSRDAVWACGFLNSSNATSTIPGNCGAGDGFLTLRVTFDRCWDGETLFADDGSHTTQQTYVGSGQSVCPATHPVPLPFHRQHYVYRVNGVDTSTLFVSSDSSPSDRGETVHADWFPVFEPEFAELFVENCNHTDHDCGSSTFSIEPPRRLARTDEVNAGFNRNSAPFLVPIDSLELGSFPN